jgi:putative ABC transport system permease protein
MLNFLGETFVLGLKNLRLHKLRSLLTALGIIFGVAAVIIMVAIGEGTKRSALEQIQQLGARNILVRSVAPPESTDASGSRQRTLVYGLTRDDLARLETIPGLETVVPLRDTLSDVAVGPVRAPGVNTIGTTPDIFDVINLQLAEGRLFNGLEYDRGAAVCVIGYQAARQLFPFEFPLGKQLRVGRGGMGTVMLTVIGVLEPSGLRAGSEGANLMQRDLDMSLYFPLTLARSTFGDTSTRIQAGSTERKQIQLTEVWLKAASVTDVEGLAKVAENVVSLGKPGIQGPRPDVVVKAPLSILRAAERTQRTFNFIMVGIAAFALVVGGIGIMNIMLATVTERTREIGIRRALGAKRRHITLQFLIETTVISLTGGLIGILIGAGFATALPFVVEFFSAGDQKYPTVIATWSVLGSFIVSGLIGIGFGLYPAVMAAHMNPIEALRHE